MTPPRILPRPQFHLFQTSQLLLLLMLLMTTLFPLVVSAQSVLSPRDLERRLKGMSDAQLEQICIERGFELITDELDEETGLPVVSTHQDYIDAAIQCIQMEDIVVNNLYKEPESKKDEKAKAVGLEANPEQHSRELRFQHLQGMVDVLIPLPKPVKRLLGRILIRLANDGTELILFVRRQFDAIVGAIRAGITEAREYEGLFMDQDRQRQQERREPDL